MSAPINRRQFLKLGGAASLGASGLLLGACGAEPTPLPETSVERKPAPSTAPATNAAPEATAGDVNVVAAKIRLKPGYALGGWDFGCNAFSQLHAAYAKKHPDVAVDKAVCSFPFDAEAALDAVKPASDLDTFLWFNSAIEPARRGLAAPLDDLFRSTPEQSQQDWHAALLDCNRFEGRLYGIPIAASVSSLMINEAFFAENKLPLERERFPKSWSELRKLATPLVRFDGDRLDRALYVPDPINMGLAQFALCAGAGGIFDADKNQFSLQHEGLIELLAFFSDWLKADYRGNAARLGQESAYFMRGVDGIDSGDMLWGTYYQFSVASVSAQKFSPMPFPTLTGTGQAAGVSGLAYSIMPQSKNAEAAFKFISEMASSPLKAFSFLGDLLPARKSSKELPAMTKLRSLRGETHAAKFAAFYADQLAQAQPLSSFPLTAFVDKAAEPVLRDVMAGKTPAKAGLQALEETLNQRLAK